MLALLSFPDGNYRQALRTMGVAPPLLQTTFLYRFIPLNPRNRAKSQAVSYALLNDLATTTDGLDHARYSRAIASFLVHPNTVGPVSVSVQAPWGAGKSSLMRQIRAVIDPSEVARLDGIAREGDTRTAAQTGARLTLAGVLAFLNRAPESELKPSGGAPDQRWTVWFNAWQYESSEQVWAGLVDAIVTQISDRLNPVERELFLLRMNLARIDDGVVREKIYNRVITFWWGSIRGWVLAAAAGIATMLGLSRLVHDPSSVTTWNPGILSAFGIQVVALVYIVGKFAAARANTHKEPAKFSLAEYLRVPDYSKSVGIVHQIHGDLRRVLQVLPHRLVDGRSVPQPLVIFIDDLDRCSPTKVATVVEGVNMFLASDLYECMFVIGMDPQMVAAASSKRTRTCANGFRPTRSPFRSAGASWTSSSSCRSRYRNRIRPA